MKPEDEILLTDYLEGDLEASKVEYVEKLLKEDAEAQSTKTLGGQALFGPE